MTIKHTPPIPETIAKLKGHRFTGSSAQYANIPVSIYIGGIFVKTAYDGYIYGNVFRRWLS